MSENVELKELVLIVYRCNIVFPMHIRILNNMYIDKNTYLASLADVAIHITI